jgi:uncharacterized protein (DUF433 family)
MEEHNRPDVENAVTELHLTGSIRKGIRVRAESQFDIDILVALRDSTPQISVKDHFRALAERLCVEHPAISTDKGIFGGMPHIKDVRLSVGDILAKLYVYGNIQKIVNIYSPHVSEEQVKEAIAYAQDFLETACAPDESSEIDD